MMIKLAAIFCFGLMMFFNAPVSAQKIELLQQGKPTSIRGLSVVDDKIAWISGSKGHIAITTDGGTTWGWQQVKGFEQADFRDIEAFSDKEAIIMSSGIPALILKTTDGGQTWQLKYRNEDKAYFLDAMDFADAKHGFILGDPIDKKFLLLETTDGGETWQTFKNLPMALEGEAAFAASGTCLRVSKHNIDVVTGGKISRHLSAAIPFKKWSTTVLPIRQGKESQGAFSVNQTGLIFVGGDYAKDKQADSVACWFDIKRAGVTNGLAPSKVQPAGYQSCVEYIADGVNLATGTSGSNITTDGGANWQQIDTTSFNVCRKAKKGKLVLLAGDKGKIGIFRP